jgi:hypothetical protein
MFSGFLLQRTDLRATLSRPAGHSARLFLSLVSMDADRTRQPNGLLLTPCTGTAGGWASSVAGRPVSVVVGGAFIVRSAGYPAFAGTGLRALLRALGDGTLLANAWVTLKEALLGCWSEPSSPIDRLPDRQVACSKNSSRPTLSPARRS